MPSRRHGQRRTRHARTAATAAAAQAESLEAIELAIIFSSGPCRGCLSSARCHAGGRHPRLAARHRPHSESPESFRPKTRPVAYVLQAEDSLCNWISFGAHVSLASWEALRRGAHRRRVTARRRQARLRILFSMGWLPKSGREILKGQAPFLDRLLEITKNEVQKKGPLLGEPFRHSLFVIRYCSLIVSAARRFKRRVSSRPLSCFGRSSP